MSVPLCTVYSLFLPLSGSTIPSDWGSAAELGKTTAVLVEDKTHFRTFVDPKFRHFYSAGSGSKSTSARVTSARGRRRRAQPQLWELEEASALLSQTLGLSLTLLGG